MNDKPLIIIAGPTATGKTETAVRLAQKIGGEVISADSMQVYKFMDIGTAKPTAAEMNGVAHYLIDEIYPDDEYSIAVFQKKATEYMAQIYAAGKVPIICGGTGFYINSLVYGNDFGTADADEAYREELYEFARTKSNAALHDCLKIVDPEAALAIHENNTKRVVRALEYFKQTGERISAYNTREKQRKPRGNCLITVLDMPRELLYERINNRVDKMIELGLVDEVKGLLDMGYSAGLVSMQGLGYKEVAEHLRGAVTLETAIDNLKLGTRHYAKRQLTWFRGQTDGTCGTWFDVTEFKNKNELAEKIRCLTENMME